MKNTPKPTNMIPDQKSFGLLIFIASSRGMTAARYRYGRGSFARQSVTWGFRPQAFRTSSESASERSCAARKSQRRQSPQVLRPIDIPDGAQYAPVQCACVEIFDRLAVNVRAAPWNVVEDRPPCLACADERIAAILGWRKHHIACTAQPARGAA